MRAARRRALMAGVMGLALSGLAITEAAAQNTASTRRSTLPRANATTAAASDPTLVLTGSPRGVRSDRTTSATALAIEVLDLKVRIRGGVAETTMTATFHNPTSEVMEGEFRFDMPAASVVTGYALDVGQDMIDGVIAGRDQAREAFQRRVVQRIDPGLAEVTWADRFSTRIFPINSNASRTIRLVMTSPVDPVQGYVLPMRPSGQIGRLTVHIESDDGRPQQVTLPRGVNGAWQGGVLTTDQWNARLSGELKLGQTTRAAPMLVSRHANCEAFFEIDDALPEGAAIGAGERGGAVHIFWDRSFSRRDDNRAAEQALVEAYLNRRRPAQIALTLFDSSGTETVQLNSVRDLNAALARVRYEGATSYRALADTTVASGATCLLVTDGRATIDSRADISMPCRTGVIASDREIERGWLGMIAGRSGGVFIDLNSTTPQQALEQLDSGGSDVGRVVDADGRTIRAMRLPAAPGRFRLVGRLPDAGAVRIVAADGAVRRSYARPTLTPPAFSGTGALWASRRIAATISDMTTRELVDLSRRYNVASPLASFIVLETPADYVEANIPPPQSYPKPLFDQYSFIRRNADQVIAQRQEGRLTEVTQAWRETVAWWTARYDGPRADSDAVYDRDESTTRLSPAERRRQQREQARRDQVNNEVDAPQPPPPPPPPAPPPPPPPIARPQPTPTVSNDSVRESDAAGSIVVTSQRIQAADRESRASSTGRRANADAAASQDARGDIFTTQDAEPTPAITIPQWSPARPWIEALDGAGDNWQPMLDRLASENGQLPLFWFDVGEWQYRKGRAVEARRAVETALELPARDNQTLAIVSARLQRYGDLDRAIALIEQLADRENERPQPLRTLAVLLMQRAEAHRVAGRNDAAKADLQRAIQLLSDAVLKVRRENYRGFEATALMDANLAVQRFRALGGRDHALPSALVRMLDVDIRVVIEWNTPRTDLDMWVEEPGGEDVGYSNRLSAWGGRLTADVTNGFGPEEYMIRVSQPGTYIIRANTFSSDRTNPNGPSTLAARLIRNFGRPDQSEELIDVEMEPGSNGRQLIGRITIGPNTGRSQGRGR